MQTNHALEKSSVNFSPNLMQAERCYITDYAGKKISEIEHIEIEKYCRELVIKAFLDVGQAKVDNTIIKLMTGGLINEILPYKNIISPTGVKTAIEKGIRKEYGEYFGINAVSFNQFLKGYMNSTERQEAILKQKQHEKKIIEERQNALNMDTGKEFTLYCYDKFKEENIIYDPANIAYDWLKKNNLIPLITKELKESIKTEAETRYISSRMNGADGVPASKYMMERLAGKTKKTNKEEEILSLCKNIHLKLIFNQITKEQIEKI